MSQPDPVKNELPYVVDVLKTELEYRKRLGIERYSTALQPLNGRNAYMDLQDELMDAFVYAKQAEMERNMMLDLLAMASVGIDIKEDAKKFLAHVKK